LESEDSDYKDLITGEYVSINKGKMPMPENFVIFRYEHTIVNNSYSSELFEIKLVFLRRKDISSEKKSMLSNDLIRLRNEASFTD
jgi:hypothetical protein